MEEIRGQIVLLTLNVSYKEKECKRLENKMKFEFGENEKKHRKKVELLNWNTKKEIGLCNKDIARLSNT